MRNKEMKYPRSKRTDEIHRTIQFICKYLRNNYVSKKHGGYNIYTDNKIELITDTYVPNVECIIKIPEGKIEKVFSCGYSGDNVTYHKGKWEEYLSNLYEQAKTKKKEKDNFNAEIKRTEIENVMKGASEEANKIFD
jgi:hypothetical protein